LSAGATSSVCPAMQHPTSATIDVICCDVREHENPGIDSSLSSVPPV
jgi:hypothetical protein